MLNHRNEPFQYRLSARRIYEKEAWLELIVSPVGQSAFEKLPSDPPIVAYILKENPEIFTGFKGKIDVGGSFGFNEGLRIVAGESGAIVFEIPILALERLGEECTECQGGGKEDFFGEEEKCFFCRGTKRRVIIDSELLFVNAKTLSLILMILSLALPPSFKGTDVPPFQLLDVETMAEEKMHGGSLVGRFSRPLVGWLKELDSEEELFEVTKVMRHTWSLMYPVEKRHQALFRHDTWAKVWKGGRFIASCPGNACDLHPSNTYETDGGYEFSSHNVDTCAQQFALLTALAALSDRALAEGVGQV